jgi:threonine/homoserine/homoserine lactone efflux protein
MPFYILLRDHQICYQFFGNHLSCGHVLPSITYQNWYNHTMLPTSSLGAVFIFSFVVAIGAVISPGPVSTAIVSQSPRRGWITGPLIATGHSFLELVLVLLISIGLSSVLNQPSIQTAIALLGGGLLVWMGLDMLVKIWRGRMNLPDGTVSTENYSSLGLVGLGMVTTISNPFWYAWWISVAGVYLLQARELGGAAIGAFYIGHISADFAWDTLLASIVSGSKRWITNRIYRGLIVACALFFIFLGGVFIAQGINSLS